MESVPFHPLVRRWFERTFAGPTPPQTAAWERISRGTDTLVAAPTGSGKTLAAFLWALDGLVTSAVEGNLEEGVRVIYVSPLKALGNDVGKNLQGPLQEIRALAERKGTPLPEIRVAVRSGDTPSRERQLQVRHPPHILITTPESLYILLTAEKSRRVLRDAGTVIVDEIHAVAGNKRGLHLALSLERLDALAGRSLQRIGLSATQKPIEEVARLLVGAGRTEPYGTPACAVVDTGHRRDMDLSIEVPDFELGPIAPQELSGMVYDRMAELVREHRATIVFVNTRRLVERVAHAMEERLGKDAVAAHHGSLSRTTRLAAEEGLKSGTVPVVVATASLELGIDVGHVDLVCHLGAPRSIAVLLQRIGRSGHFLGAVPKGIVFPLTRDDLVQSAAAIRAVRRGDLDRLEIPRNARDVLAQQIVAEVASREVPVQDLADLVRRAHPYRDLSRKDFDDVLEMLAEGVATRRGRRQAYIHHDRVHGRLRPRRGARLTAITNGGAIPDTADYQVVEDATGAFVGTVNEDFAVESMAGDVFLLGNRSWRIRRVEAGRVRVQDADGLAPTVPFWLGEAPGRTLELSAAVSDLRREVAERRGDPEEAIRWLVDETGVDAAAAGQTVSYVDETVRHLGAVPTLDTIIAERFFDEAGGMQLVVHAPFGARRNRAFGLALRKRFCVSFDFELQAAATDDGIVLSLGEQHSFPLDAVFSMIHPATIEDDLVQASLQSPMFTNRWRWNASRALALLRTSGGKKVPMPIQRMRADDLIAAVFPAQAACGDNRQGPIEPVDHPLVNETIENCLYEAMDTDGLKELLRNVRDGTVRTLAVETPAPSPMSHEILNANPYAFLDDAPLEERRARAVSLRSVDPDLAGGLGALDGAVIEEVRRQAWPEPESPDELHDVLLSIPLFPETEIGRRAGWSALAESLVSERRATVLESSAFPGRRFLVATERLPHVRVALADQAIDPPVPDGIASGRLPGSADELFADVFRGWMDALGPVTATSLSDRSGLPRPVVEGALARLESEGSILRGRFTGTSQEEVEWCERGLLSRIHRGTVARLRKEIEAVEPADFVRFLLKWQHVDPATRLHGRDGILEVIRQLGGFELPGPAWERDVFPSRIADYQGDDLEHLCLSGAVVWGRTAVSAPGIEGNGDAHGERRWSTATRATPLTFALREELDELLVPAPADPDQLGLSPTARDVRAFLSERGASFLPEIARGVSRLPTEAEDALWELVATGLVTGDGIAGLRTLLLPEDKRRSRRHLGLTVRGLRSVSGDRKRRLLPEGRWSLLRLADTPDGSARTAEAVARRLLARYGVVFRDLLARERHLPPWRELLYTLRRMEARGEIRGGRFVAGFVGEQFALPSAVDAIRATRRRQGSDEPILVSAADPLNLAGIIPPGPRVSPLSAQVVAYRQGAVVEVGELGDVLSRLNRGQANA